MVFISSSPTFRARSVENRKKEVHVRDLTAAQRWQAGLTLSKAKSEDDYEVFETLDLDWGFSLLICDEGYVLKNENGELDRMVARLP